MDRMKLFALLTGLVLLNACGDDSATGGNGSGGQTPTGGAPGSGGDGGAPSNGGGGEGEGGVGGDPGPTKRVFVTSTTLDGNLGGLVGGDAECQGLADAANLGGTWMAWLSETNGGDSPSTRFTQSSDPYVLVGGAQIAADWEDLIDGAIDVPINRDETGAQISIAIPYVWTGTSATFPSGVSPCCENWTTTESGGAKGMTDATDSKWSFNTGMNCSDLGHLYCFEQ